MGKKILIADDDPIFLKLVDKVLSANGYEVLKASNGKEALRLLFTNKPHLALLDIVMPQIDGWETCRRIREVSDIPIIMLTGEEKTEDAIVRGLDNGADDYLIKPIGNVQLVARLKAILRRASASVPLEKKDIIYNDGYLVVNVRDHMVSVNGKPIKLTPREFRLLLCLMENAGHIVSYKQLLEKVWGWEYIDDIDYIRIYISHLRQKIEPNPEAHKYIFTEPGFGYMFRNLLINN